MAPISVEPHDVEDKGTNIARPASTRFYCNLTFQVVAGLVIGIGVGVVFPHFAISMKILGDIFLRLIKTVVAPLVFFNVALGIAAAGDLKRVGRIGLKSLIYFEIVSTAALVLGLVAAHLTGVGKGMNTATGAAAATGAQYAKSTPMSWHDFFLNIVPDNFFGSFAKGELLQVLVIAVLFGMALLAIKADRRGPILESLNRMSECFFELINIIMKLAPIGAFGAIAAAVGQQGLATIVALGQLIAVMWIVAAVFVVVVLGIIGRFYGLNILRFLRYIKDEIFIVLGTSSSESVLPRLLEKLERFGCTKQTVGLVIPTGYAFNLDGTAIYISLGVVFIANAYGVPLSMHQQLGILALMMLSSKGAATVAGGTFVTFASIIAATGILPLQGVAVLFGVLRMMSPAVSVCNIIGNSVATVVIAKSSNEFDETAARQEYARVLGRSAEMPL